MAVRSGDADASELMRLHDAETNARIRLDFLLQVLSELLKSLGRDHR